MVISGTLTRAVSWRRGHMIGSSGSGQKMGRRVLTLADIFRPGGREARFCPEAGLGRPPSGGHRLSDCGRAGVECELSFARRSLLMVRRMRISGTVESRDLSWAAVGQ